MPKVSICIPAYNQVAYLKRTIDSVLSQNFTDYEIIITDDSENNLVKDFVAQYNLPEVIHYYKNTIPLGTPENWNEAIRKASGEYIKILHHDDWLQGNNSLAKYVALLDDNPDMEYGFSATRAIAPEKSWSHLLTAADLKALKQNNLVLFSNNIIGAPSTGIYRNHKNIFFDNNLKWLVDIEFYIRLLQNNNAFVYTPEILVVTGLPEGRVSDDCNNKETEVPEYLYVLESILNRRKIYARIAIKQCILKTIAVLEKYDIYSVAGIMACGYKETIPVEIRNYLSLKKANVLLGKIYKKILRNH